MPAGKDAASSIQPAGQIRIWNLNDSDGPEKVVFPFERRMQKHTTKRGKNLYFFIGVSARTTARSLRKMILFLPISLKKNMPPRSVILSTQTMVEKVSFTKNIAIPAIDSLLPVLRQKRRDIYAVIRSFQTASAESVSIGELAGTGSRSRYFCLNDIL